MSRINACRNAARCVLFVLAASFVFSAAQAWGQYSITKADFGMQCGQTTGNCLASGGVITLPTEPGTLRLWDSEVQWSAINGPCSNPPCTNYSWNVLDEYLDAIAASPNIKAVIYTFGWVPCWDATICSDTTKHRTNTPPSDLGPSGSATFNAFVDALTQHCSAKGNCVSKLIKCYEMWNEANSTTFWNVTPISTSVSELYELASSAVPHIKTHVTGAQILTPSFTASGESWAAAWVSNEVSQGIISNIYNFHTYLNTSTPETTWTSVDAPGSSASPGLLYPNFNTTGWTPLPWLNSETNFQPFGTAQPFTCYSGFSTDDCTGQVVRWQIILNSSGAQNLSWYAWNSTIGDLGSPTNYSTAYYYMMLYMVGGSFSSSSPCTYTASGTQTCVFTENGGKAALWVWTTSELGANYTVPSGYIDYRDLSGGTTTVTGGQNIAISVKPILLEK